MKAMGQANSTVYSSLPNTANDFILSPLDDSDDDEEELFSSTNNQQDEDLFLTSRYLHIGVSHIVPVPANIWQ